MARDLDTFVALQATLTALEQARQRLAGIPDWMRALHDEHAARKAEIEALERSADEAARERRAAEATVEDAQGKLRKYQQQMNQVTTQREYGALLQEIDTVKALIAGGEQSGLSALERFEQLQRELETVRERFRELDERYGVELARWEAEKPGVAAEAAGLERRAAELRASLPRPLVVQFDRIRERLGGVALAPVRVIDRGSRGPKEWHCGACNYRLRPQAVIEIRNRGALVYCESCKRLLYLEEAAGG
jgi:predicted  nucleic acid-binding Zn-ribbon protein